jgi:hypothetical protein
MARQTESWVVYLMTDFKGAGPHRAVCTRAEWDAMELDRPGHHTLVRAGFATETEAELAARGTSGDPVKRAGSVR